MKQSAIRWRRGVSVAAGAILAAGIITIPGAGAWAAPVTLPAQAALTQADAPGSVDYLVAQYHVSSAEALRRLELQRTAGGLQETLEGRLADSFAGSWIDQENGGVLMIGATRPIEMEGVLRLLPDRAHIKVVKADHSKKELQAAADRISARLGVPSWFGPVIDDVQNGLALHGKASEALRSAGGSQSLAGDQAAVKSVQDAPDRTLLACTLQNCTPPMRGGLKLYIFSNLNRTGGWIDWCTNGFNVHGSNGWQYTMTAGHCVAPSNYLYFDDDSHWVGYRNLATTAGFGGDYPADGTMMPYIVTGGVNYSEYWLNGQPKNRVWDTKKSNSLFPITGSYTYAQIGTGWVACSTGATSLNTRCGSVTGKDGGIVTNICVKGGDSGSPLFSEIDNKAYGVLSSGLTASWNGSCYTTSYFSPVSVVAAAAQSHSGISFAVNTA
jgi:streptogrisin C